jgi:N-acylneuraminate cytidylyltransferase
LPDDIQGSIDEFLAHDCDAVITTTEAHNNPYFNMIKLKENNEAELVINPNLLLAGRQKAPKVYNMTTVAYVVRPEFVLNHNSIFEGRVRAVNIPVERSIDIDTVFDFNIAEYLFILRKKINA